MRALAISLLVSSGLALVAVAQPSGATRRLLERNEMFVPRIIEVADNTISSANRLRREAQERAAP
ncbi:MAG: hypothetical protein PVF50_08000 [Gammaproteobacteria bacterium]|jgi:hypothetical protein